MADIIYLTLKGNRQGLISSGCSGYDSIGNKYQDKHRHFYFIVLSWVLIFRRKTVVIRMVRFYVYIVVPYIFCLIAWYLTNYQIRKTHYRFPEDGIVPVTDFLTISYLLHGIFFIPLVAYTCDFLLSFLFCRNKKTRPE